MQRVVICTWLTLFLLSLPAAGIANTPGKPAAAPKPTVATWAHIEIKGGYPEGAQMPGLFGDVTEGLSDGIARLDKAAADDDLAGVLLRISGPSIGWAKLNEFRQAIGRVRARDKKVYAWLASGQSMDYLLAAACDEVIMPESGVLTLLGLRAEVSFYKNLFDKLDVKADMLRIGEFKSAAEPFTRTEMSSQFRLEMEAILDDYFRQMVDAVVRGRKLNRAQVVAAIDSGPHTAVAAKKLGLIDRVAYDDELAKIIQAASAGAALTITHRYAKKRRDTDFSGFGGFVKLLNLMMGVPPSQRRSLNPRIAVIHANGVIMTGKSTADLFGGEVLGSETLVKAIRKADADDKVKAIVLRVDSPGGSALASDLIWRALKATDKPVVASMGDVAASGGYYIAMGADTIFAEPGTLTGSIGVVGGKVALSGLFDKIGITTSVISRGKNSGAMSALNVFTDDERRAMMKLLGEIYRQFTEKAARGRKMPYAQLEKLARGRVYTGRMAQKLGLVDKLGTLDDAVEYAKRLAGLKPEDKIDRLILPPPVSPLEQLFGPLDSDARAGAAQSRALLQTVRSVSPELAEQLGAAHVINLLAREGRLTLMPFRLRVK